MEGWDPFARAEPELAEKGNALLYQRGDGEGFLTTVALNGTPRIHPLNVGVRDGHLLVFIQGHSAKAGTTRTTPCMPTSIQRRRTSSWFEAKHGW